MNSEFLISLVTRLINNSEFIIFFMPAAWYNNITSYYKSVPSSDRMLVFRWTFLASRCPGTQHNSMFKGSGKTEEKTTSVSHTETAFSLPVTRLTDLHGKEGDKDLYFKREQQGLCWLRRIKRRSLLKRSVGHTGGSWQTSESLYLWESQWAGFPRSSLLSRYYSWCESPSVSDAREGICGFSVLIQTCRCLINWFSHYETKMCELIHIRISTTT